MLISYLKLIPLPFSTQVKSRNEKKGDHEKQPTTNKIKYTNSIYRT